MNRPCLRVLVVAANQQEAIFASRVLSDHEDEAFVAEDVTHALARLSRSETDVALVSLSLPRGDGLALVHHLRALHPDVDVLVMAHASELEESQHAMALGVLATVVLPLTGDALMVAVDRARERRVLIQERLRLAREGAESRRRSATYARCAAFVAETDARTIARRVLDACAAELDSNDGAAYLPVAGQRDRYARVATLGDAASFASTIGPDEIDRLDPSAVVSRNGRAISVCLMGGTELSGIVRVALPSATDIDEPTKEALDVVAALGTATLGAARKVDAIARSGIKDPDTSAYTFAYFGDVAGREIDRAARYARRFSLLTVGFERAGEAVREREIEARKRIADALLDAVRDSDVVAHVEDDEFYLLLPESGLLGALACRRRIEERFASTNDLGLEPIAGIAVYPSDGEDLGRLLRSSRRRAERSRNGVWRRLGLRGRSFWDTVDRLLGSEDDAVLARDGTVSLHASLRAAHDEAGLSRHAAMDRRFIPELGAAVAYDAARQGLAGTLYVAGDAELVSAVLQTVQMLDTARLRAWCLGPTASPQVRRYHLPLDDPRFGERVVLLTLHDFGGYVLLARPINRTTMLAYHSSDLDLADGLTRALQATYHLQPEAR
jgi:DNA-binding NarL/FixJ family response regulator/GGDEF domain-containing protein